MAKATNRLKGLRVHEISGVDRPANIGARTLLWKRDDGEEPKDVNLNVHVPDLDALVQKKFDELIARGEWDRALAKGAAEPVEKAPAPEDLHADAFLGAKRKMHGHVKALRNKLKGARKPADVHAAMGAFASAYGAAMQGVAKALEERIAKGPGADAFAAAQAAGEAQDQLRDVLEDTYEAMDDLRSALCAIQEDQSITDKAAAIREATQAALASLTAPDPDDDEGSVGKGAGSPPALPTSEPAAGDGQTEDKSVPESTLEAQLADLKARLEKAEADKAAAETKAQEVAKAEGERVAKMEADLKKAAEDATAAQAIAKAEREMRLEAEFTKRAEAELADLKGAAVEKGRMLRAIVERSASADEAVKKQAEAELEMLKAANAAARLVFGEIGKAGKPASDSALAELDQRASELVKADPKLTLQQARDRAMDADVALQKRYLEERANGH